MHQTVLLKRGKIGTCFIYNIVTHIMYIFFHYLHITLEANKGEQRYYMKIDMFQNNKMLTNQNTHHSNMVCFLLCLIKIAGHFDNVFIIPFRLFITHLRFAYFLLTARCRVV